MTLICYDKGQLNLRVHFALGLQNVSPKFKIVKDVERIYAIMVYV